MGLQVRNRTFMHLFYVLVTKIMFLISYNVCNFSQRVVDLAHLVANKWPGTPKVGSGDPLEDFCETNPADEECKVYE